LEIIMTVSLNPVSFESNYPGLVITAASAVADEVAPLSNDQQIDNSHDLKATISWSHSASLPVDISLGFLADWQAKAILQNVEGGGTITRTASSPFVVGSTGGNFDLTFSGVAPGTYRLYVTNHLRFKAAFGGGHMAVSMTSEGATFEVYDSALVA
jgi:hypothetical protein